MYLAPHVVPIDHFDRLASGGGGPDTVAMLVAAERSRRLLLLRAILDSASEQEAYGPLPGADQAWNTLITLQGRAPEQFDEVLMQPQVGMWMAHSLRRLHGKLDGDYPLWVDTGYVFNIAVAIAANAGLEFRAMVPCHGDSVMFPTLGLVVLGAGEYFNQVEASVGTDFLRVRSGHGIVELPLTGQGEIEDWWRLRRIRAWSGAREQSLWLDDIDPYRQIGKPVPADRIPDAHVHRWETLFGDACGIVEGYDPEMAAAMALGFKSVVPLPEWPALPLRSASSGDSFGSALISMPLDPDQFAATLVHEFQHIKLGGLLHLLAFHPADSRPRFYAPWRDDPRPLGGLLQGVYAFLGVTEFWRARRRRDSSRPARDSAEFEFALWREQTWHASQALAADNSLTSTGRRFVDGMMARMRQWWTDDVNEPMLAAARIAADDHRTGWRIRYARPAPEFIAELAEQLSAGHVARCRELGEPCFSVIPGPATSWSHQRLALTRLKFSSPAEFGRRLRHPTDDTLLTGDLALVSGDCPAAVSAYAQVVGACPELPDAWTGLLLALSGHHGDYMGQQLSYPELLPAVHGELLASGRPMDPVETAHWLHEVGL